MNANSAYQTIRGAGAKGFIVAGCVLAALALGILIPRDVLSPKMFLALAGGVVVLLLILRGNAAAWGALYLVSIASFAVGYRSLYIGPTSFVVPAELIAWVLAVVILAQNALARKPSLFPVPKSILFLVVWCFAAFFWTPNILQRWDAALAMVKLWILALPVFYVTLNLITRLAQVQTILKLLMPVALVMSVLGIVEFVVPGVARLFPWFFDLQIAVLDTQQGFVRSYMSFWGNPIGVIIVGWGVMAALDELLHGQFLKWKILALVTMGLGLVMVYFAGQRATWLSLAIGLPLLMFLSGKRASLLLFFLPALTLLPDNFWLRFYSALPFSQSFRSDTSILSRIDRYELAISEFQRNPLFGVGLGGDLAHNEFLAFAAHAGLFAALAFVVFLVQLLVRLWRTYAHAASPQVKRFSRLFLALFVTFLVDLNFHPALGVAPVAAPYWFMLALAWQVTNLGAGSET